MLPHTAVPSELFLLRDLEEFKEKYARFLEGRGVLLSNAYIYDAASGAQGCLVVSAPEGAVKTLRGVLPKTFKSIPVFVVNADDISVRKSHTYKQTF